MTIDYSISVAYGFPTGRGDIYEMEGPLAQALASEGLLPLTQGSQWSGKMQSYVVIRESHQEIDYQSPGTDALEFDRLFRESSWPEATMEALVARAEEMGVSPGKIGWYVITVVY